MVRVVKDQETLQRGRYASGMEDIEFEGKTYKGESIPQNFWELGNEERWNPTVRDMAYLKKEEEK